MQMKNRVSTFVLAILVFAGLSLASANAYVGISVAIAPPAIPVYTQPYCPGPGYIWTPGYWAWNGYDHYWVPGVWVYPPTVGFLWTPGYWGYNNGLYVFNDGYWGPNVGFYGGINYGYGYGGHGYYGARWVGNTLRYNTAVTRVNPVVIPKTYTYKAPAKVSGSRAGFNGPGGAKAKPTAQEQTAAKAQHVPPTSEQRALVDSAKNNPDLHAKNNHGKPKTAAVQAAAGQNGEATNVAAGGEKANPAEQARTERAKTTNRTAEATEQSKAKAHRTAEASTAHFQKTTQTSHKTEVRHTSTAPNTVKHAPTVAHQPQQMKSHQVAGGPTQEQNAKKKKKDKEKPKG